MPEFLPKNISLFGGEEMAKLVKEIRPETRKTLILALVCLCIVVCSAFSGFTVAKYQRQLADDEHSIPAAEFYFTSDILREGGNTATIYEWNKSAYAFNIYNYDIMDEDKISTFNLTYSLAVSSVSSGTFSNGTYTKGSDVTGTLAAKIGSTAFLALCIVHSPFNRLPPQIRKAFIHPPPSSIPCSILCHARPCVKGKFTGSTYAIHSE